MRRIAGDVLLWLALSALLPMNGERIADGAYVNGLIVASLVVAVAVGVRRVAPLAALVLTGGLLAADVWLFGPFAGLSFLIGRSAVRPRPALWTFVALGVSAPLLTLGRTLLTGGDRWYAYYLVGEVVFCGVFPWLVGRYLWQRRELAAGGWALAGELERGQTLVAEKARLRERTRIAEDMHDALGHELSLLALRAGALELDPTLGESQRAAATELREGAAAATERLRAVIGVLRTDATAPLQPVEETLEALVDRVRRAGLVLDFPVGARDALPPLVDRAVYRVVQEALTNAARHAPGAPVTGRLTGDEDSVTVEVANPIDAPADASAPGTGLLGLAERVRLAGGTFHAGAEAGEGTATGTFRVVATVPRVPAGPVPEPVPESAGRLESARKRTRRGLVLTVVVPVLAGVLLVGVVLAGYVVETTASVVDPWDQLRIHLGQPEDEARDILPLLQVSERPDVVEPSKPAGSECVYYNVSGKLFPPARDVYRVCFAGGVVAAIDLIPGPNSRGGRR
ncbi:sensor histidine kinase [Cryptosporangium arvum]|uniref:sensor histidine kinase n=1 Tax=Cryptosporangium arvum TaxID=80871 RepID=UPI00055FF5F6|nr:histidine kinase [Cryptosporangium arvum]